jgi:predicted TIM-barrel fold metal-dependent hydrolase
MEASGVDKAIIRPLKPPDLDLDKANREIADIQRGNENLVGFGRVNPLLKDAVIHTRKAINEYGLKGIHLHPWEENYHINSDVVDKVMQVIKGENIPVYISAGYPMVSHPLQVQDLLSRYPEVTFIVTHGGQQDISGLSFDDSLLVAEENNNIVFDISGVYRRDFIERLVETAGADRVVFGSCTPYMNMKFEITRITSTHLSEATKKRILHTNLEELLNRHQR